MKALVVERVAEKLKRAGLEPWLDKWYLIRGGRFQEELAAGLAASSACAVFIGTADLGNWQREELGVAQNRAASDRDFRLFPVLLPGLPEPLQPSALPPFLSTRTWVDFRRGHEDTRALQLLVNAVKGVAPGPEAPIEPFTEVCPYRGLQTFDEEHTEFFFGREGDVQRLLEKLKASRFLAVVGPSGSGKSSLVRAGLVPALRRGGLLRSESWAIRVLRPGAHPLTVLTAHLLRLYPHATMQRTLDELAADERTLHLAVSLALANGRVDQRVVWVVDQAEEVFTLCRDKQERNRFFDNLLYAASVPAGQSVLVLTLRADFYPRAAAYAKLAQHVAEQQFLVSPMDEEDLRLAIEEPARRVGLEFESGLIGTILDDVAREPGARARHPRWRERHRRGGGAETRRPAPVDDQRGVGRRLSRGPHPRLAAAPRVAQRGPGCPARPPPDHRGGAGLGAARLPQEPPLPRRAPGRGGGMAHPDRGSPERPRAGVPQGKRPPA